jgi:hypothetical protein
MRSDVSLDDGLHLDELEQPASAPDSRRSRRSLLAAALGGIAGMVGGSLGRPDAVRGAAGDSLKVGQSNYAGTNTTRLNTTSSGGAFWMTQYGYGSGVRGDSVNGHGMVATTQHGDRFGLDATNAGAAGSGAAINADGGSGHHGVIAHGLNAVFGVTTTTGYAALYGESQGTTGATYGIYGYVSGDTTGSAAYGEAQGGATGVTGTSQTGIGVYGGSSGSAGQGIYGACFADSSGAYAVYAYAAQAAAYAGYFVGNLHTTGTLSKAGGTFRIDHPLDPANKVLQHSFVESPEMKNLYDGIATAGPDGSATVELPTWFMALNRDFRYTLTPIGAFAPLFVQSELTDGRFTIGGAQPGQRVSWLVTGIRHDAWATAHPIEVEAAKHGDDRGRYLHPIEHGQPATRGLDWSRTGGRARPTSPIRSARKHR